MWRALHHRDFALYAAGGFVSNVGLWFQRVGVQWLVWSLTGSLSLVATVALIEAACFLASVPFFGTVSDRYDRLLLGRIAQVFLMGLAAILAALTILDFMTIFLLMVLMGLAGFFEALWSPVRLAMAPSLVPRNDLPSAIGIGSILFNLAQFVGPALGAVIIAAFTLDHEGIGWLFALNAFSFLGYLIVLLFIRLRHDEVGSRPRSNFVADLREGILYILTKKELGLFFILIVATMIFMRSYRESLTAIADGIYAMEELGFGIMQSASGAGAIIGSIMVAKVNRVSGMVRLLFIAALLAGLLHLALSATGSFWIAAIIVGGISAFGSYIGIGGQLVVQNSIDGSLRGRVMSLWSMNLRGGPAAGAWLWGLGDKFWALQSVIAVSTVVYLLILGALLPRLRGIAAVMERPSDETARAVSSR